MKNNSLISILCLLLSLFVALTAFAGCSKKTEENPSSVSSDLSSEQQTESTLEEESQTPSSEEKTADDEWEEIPTDDDFSEDEEEIYFQELTVKNKSYTNENFLGFNFIHQLANGYPDMYDRVYSQKQIDLELDTMQKMGVKMIRSYYGSSLAWDPVKKQHDFENEWMKAFYQNCLDMQKIGVEVGITPQWDLKSLVDGTSSLPTVSGWGQECMGYLAFKQDEKGKTVPDIEATANNFADFVKDSVLAFRAHGVNNVKQMFCFTECNNSIHLYGVNKKAGATASRESREYERLYPIYDAMIRAVDKGLKDAGVREKYQIVGPCDNWASVYGDDSEPYSLLTKYTVENLKGVVDVIGSHNGYDRAPAYVDDMYYDQPFIKLSDPMNRANAAGMEYWIDEFNAAVITSGGEENARTNKNVFKGTAVAAMANSVMNMGGVSNLYIWALYDQQWPNSVGGGEFINGMHMVGYLPSLLNSTTPYPAYYALSLITRYVGQGKLFACEVGEYSVYISAIERHDGEITLIVTNFNAQPENFKINFEKSLGGKTFYRYLYQPSEIKPAPGNDMIKADAVAKKVKTQFADTLPEMGVAIYTTEKPQK